MPQPPPTTGPAADAARAFRLAIEQDCARHGWTYQQLISRTTYSPDHILSILEGRQRPTRKVAAALDVAFETGSRYYELWERFHHARHATKGHTERANTPDSRYPGDAAATTPHDGTEDDTNRREAVTALGALLLTGATRARQLLRVAESPNVGPLTLDDYDDTVWWLSRNAGVQPLTTLITTADRAAGEVSGLMLEGKHSGKHRTHLELLTGQLAFFQGLFAFEFGEYEIARTHLRLARHYGQQLDSTRENGPTATLVLASVADTETNLALYGGHFDRALEIVRDAQRYATDHTTARLAALEARALAGASPGHHRELNALLDRSEAAIPSRPAFEPGAVPPFGPERFLRFTAALARCGHDRAEKFARAAVQQYETLEVSKGEHFHHGNLALARLDLATAMLRAKQPEPEEAMRLGAQALTVPPRFQVDYVRRRTVELLTMVHGTPKLRDLAPVKEFANVARSYQPPALPAPPSRREPGSS